MSSSVLCLACSGSLPPSHKGNVYWTSCCERPICPSCVSANPRLARYNPCLSCLSGVSVFTAEPSKAPLNIDAAVRDDETFVLGDSDDSDEDDQLRDAVPLSKGAVPGANLAGIAPNVPFPVEEEEDPTVYHVKPGDTMLGISMRLRVNGRELCRLNGMPPSTLTTTPHILHTRATLILPGHIPKGIFTSPAPHTSSSSNATAQARERAEKKLQAIAKEVDWRVAKAYVALADDPDEEALHAMKRKEMGGGSAGAPTLEDSALDRYLDDDAWEQEEINAGRTGIRRMPLPRVGLKA